MKAAESLRLFFAIQIPEPIRAKLYSLQLELQPMLSHDIARWTKPGQLHLTLKFLGNVPVNDVAVLNEAARTVCSATSPLHLRAEGTGFFPNDISPRVFWTDIKSMDGRLQEFQQRLEVAVERFAEKKESKKFSAHITLARLEKLRRHDVEKLKAHAQTDKALGEWTVREVELVQSQLKQTGAVYATVAVYRTKNE